VNSPRPVDGHIGGVGSNREGSACQCQVERDFTSTPKLFPGHNAEASEMALLMARFATQGQSMICSDATDHGNSTEVRKMSMRALMDPHFWKYPIPTKVS